MIKQILYLVIFFSSFSIEVSSQNVFQVNAGSRAPYGKYQNLVIDITGKCTFTFSEVNGKIIETSSFNITAAELNSLYGEAEKIKFFELNEKYDGGYSDGYGVFVAMRRGNRKHYVSLVNIEIPEINQLIKFLNNILKPHNIRIYYGQALK